MLIFLIKEKLKMNFEDKIKELNIKLPDATDPVGSYVAYKKIGKMLFISGQISIDF